MNSRAIITVGDTTTHGGVVLEGFEQSTVDGRPTAGIGHRVRCPACKGVFPIIEGDDGFTVDGVAIALEGMKTKCGARLIASQSHAVVEPVEMAHAFTQVVGPGMSWPTENAEARPSGARFYVCCSTTDAPLSQRSYVAEVDGQQIYGKTDDDGYAHIVAPEGARIKIHVPFSAPKRTLTAQEVQA